MDLAIRFRGVSKRFGAVRALDGLDLDVPAGRLTGFVGPNGAGKTTTFRTLLGLTRFEGGTIEVFGQNVSHHLSHIVKRIGAIVEDPGLHDRLSAHDNMRVAALTLGRGEDSIDALLEFVGLADTGNRRAEGFSKGMRQRLGLATALIGDPDILVLDEPLDGLDPIGQIEFKRRLRVLVEEEHKTIVVSSHDMGDVEQLADHLVVIHHGRVVAQGPMAEILDRGQEMVVQVDDLAGAVSVLVEHGFDARIEDEVIRVAGADGAEITRALAERGRYLHSLIPTRSTLEEVFLELTRGGEEP